MKAFMGFIIVVLLVILGIVLQDKARLEKQVKVVSQEYENALSNDYSRDCDSPVSRGNMTFSECVENAEGGARSDVAYTLQSAND